MLQDRSIKLIALICVGIISFVGVYIFTQKSTNPNLPDQSVKPLQSENISDSKDQTSLDIILPSKNTIQNGLIEVKGVIKDTSLRTDLLKVRITDKAENAIGYKEIPVEISADSQEMTWSTYINIMKSPKTLDGTISLYNKDDNLLDSVKITFDTQKDKNQRLKLFAPLENQVISRGELLFRGEMSGFFEGVMNVRIKDENGNILLEDIVQADSENYGLFAYFEKLLNINNLQNYKGDKAVVEIYETSAKDGSESIVYSFNVRY